MRKPRGARGQPAQPHLAFLGVGSLLLRRNAAREKRQVHETFAGLETEAPMYLDVVAQVEV